MYRVLLVGLDKCKLDAELIENVCKSLGKIFQFKESKVKQYILDVNIRANSEEYNCKIFNIFMGMAQMSGYSSVVLTTKID